MKEINEILSLSKQLSGKPMGVTINSGDIINIEDIGTGVTNSYIALIIDGWHGRPTLVGSDILGNKLIEISFLSRILPPS